MYLQNTLKLKSFSLSSFISLLLLLNILPVNSIYRKEEDFSEISQNIKKLIQTKSFDKSYTKINDDFMLTMKFTKIIFNSEPINYDEKFFSFIKPFFDFILTITIEDIRDIKHSPSNTASILFDKKIKLIYNNLHAYLSSEYLQFEKFQDNTFNYSFYYGEKNIETNIDFENYLKFNSQNYYIKKFENALNDLLFESLCNIFEEILKEYPISDSLFIYNKIVNWIVYTNGFKVDFKKDKNLERVYVHEFREEKHEKEIGVNAMKFENIHAYLEFQYKDGNKLFKNIIVDEIQLSEFVLYVYIKKEVKVGNIKMTEILNYLFREAKSILFPNVENNDG